MKTNLTPFEKHGRLCVKGTDLVDVKGNLVRLHGPSTFGLMWAPEYVDFECFKDMRDDFNSNAIRLAMYTIEWGGYCSNGDKEKIRQIVDDGVRYATELGMYVIIDWHVLHDEDPLVYADEAERFFDLVSKKYADHENVIYEICNEPNNSGTWDKVTEYANRIIPVIRKNAPEAVIVVGTPVWSQNVDEAADKPLAFDNIMYSMHFYAAEHHTYIRNKLVYAHEKGLPVMISECNITMACGDGVYDYEQADKWMSLMDEYGLSIFVWSLKNNAHSSSLFKESCSKISGWSDDELTEAGLWMKKYYLELEQ